MLIQELRGSALDVRIYDEKGQGDRLSEMDEELIQYNKNAQIARKSNYKEAKT